MSKPIAVCISDIHFNLNNLELSTKALQAAINKATELDIPLVIAGDLHDTKAIIRAEVANRLISLLKSTDILIYILVGNHDLINEKVKDNSLEYLNLLKDVILVKSPVECGLFGSIPYQTSNEAFIKALNYMPYGKIIIAHQGFQGAFMGDYIQDKSSIPMNDELFRYKIISGHYHRHQMVGPVTYIGSPFTMSFGEANDGPKGFLVLNDDGSYERVILNLRKHVIVERTTEDLLTPQPGVNSDDLLWVKVRGPRSELAKIKKAEVGAVFLGHSNFKLDLIPTDQPEQKPEESTPLTDSELLDTIIDSTNETSDQKKYLKELYREIVTVDSK